MGKLAFFSFPLSGHVNPQIGLCKALGEKGVEMIFYTSKVHFHKFNDIDNIVLKEYPKEFQEYFDKVGKRKEIHNKMLIMLSTFYHDADLLMDYTINEILKEKPDALVCDQFSIWGRTASKYFNIPQCKFFSSIMGDSIVSKNNNYLEKAIFKMIITQGIYLLDIKKSMRNINKKYGNICLGINEVMTPGDDMSLVMTSRKFHPGGDQYPRNVKFIGADHVRTLEKPKKKDKIFISLGTVSIRENFFESCIEATKHLGFQIVITLAGNKEHDVSNLEKYSNVRIYDNLNFEDYRKIMNESALFISHGGFNGVTTSLLYETPLLICPSSPEHINNMKLIQKYKCGSGYYKKKIGIDELREIVDGILFNKEIQSALKEQSEALKQSLGYEKTADIMIDELGLD